MGLAPYGEPKYASLILDKLIDLDEDGSFWLDQSYFDYCVGLRMTNDRFPALFGSRRARPEELLTQRQMDIAASIQAVTEQRSSSSGARCTRKRGPRSVHGRWRRAQLRGQREVAQGADLRFDLDPAGGGRCRWRGRRGARRLPPVRQPAAQRGPERRHVGGLSRPALRQEEIEGGLPPPAHASQH